MWKTVNTSSRHKDNFQTKKYYQPQNLEHTITAAYEISTFLTHLNTNYYIYDDFLRISPTTPRTPMLYMLPKIHKPHNPEKLIIISGCDLPTAKLSIFLDYYSKPVVQSLPLYIKNIHDFLKTYLHQDSDIPPTQSLLHSMYSPSTQTYHKMRELKFVYQPWKNFMGIVSNYPKDTSA